VQVYIIGQSPQFIADVQHIDYISGNYRSSSRASWTIAFDPTINSAIAAQAAEAKVIDPLSFLCQQDNCRYRDGSVFLYADYGHYSKTGSMAAVRAFFPIGNSAARPQSGKLEGVLAN
jgi:hypothetical protein